VAERLRGGRVRLGAAYMFFTLLFLTLSVLETAWQGSWVPTCLALLAATLLFCAVALAGRALGMGDREDAVSDMEEYSILWATTVWCSYELTWYSCRLLIVGVAILSALVLLYQRAVPALRSDDQLMMIFGALLTGGVLASLTSLFLLLTSSWRG
jgi:hypothetical protein